MLDTVCKHHLSGAFTSGHETRVHGAPAALVLPGAAERLPGSARPTFAAPLEVVRDALSGGRRAPDPERALPGEARQTGRGEIVKLA